MTPSPNFSKLINTIADVQRRKEVVCAVPHEDRDMLTVTLIYSERAKELLAKWLNDRDYYATTFPRDAVPGQPVSITYQQIGGAGA